MRARQPVVAFGLSGASLILLTAAEVMIGGSLHALIDKLDKLGAVAPAVAICAIIIGGFLLLGVRKLNESMERRRERREEVLSPAEESQRQHDRKRLLKTLRNQYDCTPHPNGWLHLDLEEQLDLVRTRPDFSRDIADSPPHEASQQGTAPPRTTSRKTLAYFYHKAEGYLLLVGPPGSGKTTLLRDLADTLLADAEGNPTAPLPVLLDLSRWARKRLPLRQWLVAELVETYHLERAIAESWVTAEGIVPLLDGLDKVALRHRGKCAEAINAYQREHALVVTCRSAEYDALPLLHMVSAVAICPLDLGAVQITPHLRQAGRRAHALRDALRTGPACQDLYATPLGLRLLLSPPADHERELDEAVATRDDHAMRTALVKLYVDYMLKRDRDRCEPKYPAAATGDEDGSAGRNDRFDMRKGLKWLAAHPAASSGGSRGGVFHIEEFEPGWLPQEDVFNGHATWICLGSLFFFGVAIALIGALRPSALAGWLYGLIVGAAIGWFVSGDARLTIGVRWSRGWAIPGFVCGLLFGPTGGFVVWLFFALLAVVAQIGDWAQSWQRDLAAWLRRRGLFTLTIAGAALLVLAWVAPDLSARFARLSAVVVLRFPHILAHLVVHPVDSAITPLLHLLAGVALAVFTGFLPARADGSDGPWEIRGAGPTQDIGQTMLVSGIAAVGITLMVGIDSHLAGAPAGLPSVYNMVYMPFLAGLLGGIALAVFGGVSALLRALLLSRLVGDKLAPSQESYERFLEDAANHGLLLPKQGGYCFSNEVVRKYLEEKYLEEKYLEVFFLQMRYTGDQQGSKQARTIRVWATNILAALRGLLRGFSRSATRKRPPSDK